ncbi:hypothetical protein ABC642_03760 [Lactobacillus helveticus]|uniref:hypothetical protein n=1 Tax=Lactobacillus helveticus TaxID=1587 RepID=UPI0031D69F8B
MKKLSKFTAVAMTSATLLTVIVPTISSSVSASTINSDTKSANSGNTQTFVIPKRSIVPENTEVQQTLSENIAQSGTLTNENRVKTFEISNDALLRAINKAYGNEFSAELAKRHHAGVTKVKNYGNGNINVYLSKSMLNKIRTEGYSVAFGAVLSLISAALSVPSMGVASWAIAAVSKKLVGAMLGQVSPYKVGRVYKIRGWRYAGWRYQ